MIIRVCSDLHLEFVSYNKLIKHLAKILPTLPTDVDSTLVCAGDIGVYTKYSSTIKPFVQHVSQQFKNVVIINGNHEFYGSIGIWGNEAEFWKDKKLPKNVHYLDNDYKIIDDVMFIGSCLWTDFGNDPLAMWNASRKMNDYEVIRKSGGPYGTSVKLQPEDTVERHRVSVDFIRKALQISKEMGLKQVVVTHTAPTAQSVNDKYRGDLLNGAYYSDLSELILDYGPAYWFHGHMHDACRYTVDKTEVICNPYGYKDYEVCKTYDSTLAVEV